MPDWEEFILHAGTGSLASMAGIYVGAPLDTIKVNLQSRASEYTGFLNCLTKTIRTQGVLALFKGSLTAALGQAPNCFVVFGSYGSTLNTLNQHYPPDTPLARYLNVYIAGTWAGFLQSLVLSPFEHIKCQQQVNDWSVTGRRIGMVECAKSLMGARGVAMGLYRGFWSLAWREAPSYGVYFMVYDMIKDGLTPVGQEPSSRTMLFAGGWAGVASWVVATPLDVIKSIIQGSPISTDPKELRIKKVAMALYKAEGFKGFFRGLSTSVVRAFPVNAVTFFVYESLLAIFQPPPTNDSIDKALSTA